MNFTIGLIAGALDCLGETRVRNFIYCLPMHSGRRADGFDWITDRYCIAFGRMTRSEDDE